MLEDKLDELGKEIRQNTLALEKFTEVLQASVPMMTGGGEPITPMFSGSEGSTLGEAGNTANQELHSHPSSACLTPSAQGGVLEGCDLTKLDSMGCPHNPEYMAATFTVYGAGNPMAGCFKKCKNAKFTADMYTEKRRELIAAMESGAEAANGATPVATPSVFPDTVPSIPVPTNSAPPPVAQVITEVPDQLPNYVTTDIEVNDFVNLGNAFLEIYGVEGNKLLNSLLTQCGITETDLSLVERLDVRAWVSAQLYAHVGAQ